MIAGLRPINALAQRPAIMSPVYTVEHASRLAGKIRDKHRSKTLGRAINLTRKENLLPESLQEALDKFLLERNWLIHKSIQNEDEMLSEPNVSRIKSINQNARKLKELIEADLFQYSSSVGVDMSRVQAQLKQGG